MSFSRRCVVVLGLLLVGGLRGVAQKPDSTAVVVGRVLDPDGDALAGAHVVAGPRGILTDSTGAYRLERLLAGPVRLQARLIGFKARDTTLVLVPGQTVQWNVRLAIDTTLAAFEAEETRGNLAADSANQVNGVVDSAANGLLPKRAPGLPPYERFGARMLAAIAKERGADSNTVISPLSAGMALALVAGGSRGATYDALAKTLDAGLDATALSRRDSLLLASLSARKDVTLEVANALWVSPRYKLQPSYVVKGTTSYRSEVRSVNLASDGGIPQINAWAKEKTHGKIPVILPEPLPDSTALVVTNAVYFRGFWLKAFETKATRPLAFHRKPGVIDSVPGMERTAKLHYLKRSKMQIVRLPYRGGRASMFVVLPDSGVRMETVEAELAESGLPSLISEYQRRDVHLRLPRVHAEISMNLRPALTRLGGGIAFDCNRADFNAMLVLLPEQRACIDRAVQKTYIDIDEKGTEAAAVTAYAMIVATGYTTPPPPIEFIVDRPFVFVLRDEVSGVPLFMGRIVHPGTTLK